MFTNETTSFILRCVRKTIWMLLVLWGITLVSFFVIHLAPGTPTDMQTTLNPLAGEAARARLEALYGIDRPLYIQYFDWLSRIVQLDFGNSMSSDARPVIEKIAERLPLTIGINVISLLLTLLIAVPIGVLSAWKQGSLFDKGMTVLVFLGFAMPGFWLALLLMLYTGLEHQWLPISGLMSLDYESLSFWGKLMDLGRHLVLPITVITVGSVAGMSRFMRSSMLEVLRQDFILTAKAKGLPARVVIFRHALRNALLPVITLLGLSVPGLIGGSVIIETIFALPGLGQLFYAAVMARDYPLIMGTWFSAPCLHSRAICLRISDTGSPIPESALRENANERRQDAFDPALQAPRRHPFPAWNALCRPRHRHHHVCGRPARSVARPL